MYFLQTMIIILYIKNTGDIFTKYFKKSFSTTGNDFLFFFHFGVTLGRKYDIRIQISPHLDHADHFNTLSSMRFCIKSCKVFYTVITEYMIPDKKKKAFFINLLVNQRRHIADEFFTRKSYSWITSVAFKHMKLLIAEILCQIFRILIFFLCSGIQYQILIKTCVFCGKNNQKSL